MIGFIIVYCFSIAIIMMSMIVIVDKLTEIIDYLKGSDKE